MSSGGKPASCWFQEGFLTLTDEWPLPPAPSCQDLIPNVCLPGRCLFTAGKWKYQHVKTTKNGANGYMYQTCLAGFVAIISIYKSRQFLLYYKHMLEATMIHSPACQIRSFKPKAFCVPFQKGWIIPVAKPHRLGVGGWSKGHDKQHKPIWGYIVYLPSLSIYLSIYRSFYLSIYRCICESIYCIYQWIYLYVYRSISIYLSIYQSACLSSCLSRKFHKTNTHCWFIDANTIDLKQWKHR